MKVVKQMGIWMDHSNAVLMELVNNIIVQNNIVSEFTSQEKVSSLSHSESLMHHKEDHQQASYYKKLGNTIRNCEEVVLFGPTNAKDELLNLLEADPLFGKTKIVVKDSDKMTENQMHAYVRDYFSK